MPPPRKSCEGCRTAKTRCDIEVQSYGVCSRCSRLSLPCVLSDAVQAHRRRPQIDLAAARVVHRHPATGFGLAVARVHAGMDAQSVSVGHHPLLACSVPPAYALGAGGDGNVKIEMVAGRAMPPDTSSEMSNENLHWVWPLHRDLLREERDNAVRLWWIRSAFTTARRHGNWGVRDVRLRRAALRTSQGAHALRRSM